MENKENFDIANFLIINLAKEISHSCTIVQGTSTFIPLIATKFAMKKKKINFIGGFSINPDIEAKIPSTFCQKNFKNAKQKIGLKGFLDVLIQGKVDLEFLRPAQVDKYGNMNNTVIGNYLSPKVRFPGGMGVDDVMHYLKNAILYSPNHNKKTFVEKVDFVTASGWNKGKGPKKIITNLGIFEFPNKKITLTAINPLYSVKDIQEKTGFKFEISKNLKKMDLVDETSKKEIQKCDPKGLRYLEIKEKRQEILKQFRD